MVLLARLNQLNCSCFLINNLVSLYYLPHYKQFYKWNRKISRVVWQQNGDELWLKTETEFYRKFNPYQHEEIKLYFDSSPDSYSCKFNIEPEYKAELEVLIEFDNPDDYDYNDTYRVYINGEIAICFR